MLHGNADQIFQFNFYVWMGTKVAGEMFSSEMHLDGLIKKLKSRRSPPPPRKVN